VPFPALASLAEGDLAGAEGDVVAGAGEDDSAAGASSANTVNNSHIPSICPAHTIIIRLIAAISAGGRLGGGGGGGALGLGGLIII
jgi:hypothetical protein